MKDLYSIYTLSSTCIFNKMFHSWKLSDTINLHFFIIWELNKPSLSVEYQNIIL